MEHSKAPWTFQDAYRGSEILSRDGQVIADIKLLSSKGKSRANAELIAAAPDLLEALHNLIENAEFDYHNDEFAQHGLEKETADLIEKGRAAIKKATSEKYESGGILNKEYSFKDLLTK